MPLVGEVEQPGGHALPLERREHLQTLAYRHPEIELAVHDERRRLEVRREPVGAPPLVALDIVVRRAAEIPLGKPELFGNAILAYQVERARHRDERLEAVRVARDPVHHVAAVGRARGADPFTVNVGQGDEVIQPLHDVLVALTAPILADRVHELLPESFAPVKVGDEDHVARRRECLHVPVRVPVIEEGRLGAAVYHHDRGVDLLRIESGRFYDKGLYLCPSGALVPHILGPVHLDIPRVLIVETAQTREVVPVRLDPPD